ncbi:MAG TPA: peptidase [Crinalium sp.]|jgi:Sec-independent protein secretion pathway component TatC
MKNPLRKCHQLIALLFCLPLFFTGLTGISIAVADQWFHQDELAAFLISVHTFQIFKLDAILPVVNGLGLIGLVVTGLSMTRLVTKHHKPKRIGDRP